MKGDCIVKKIIVVIVLIALVAFSFVACAENKPGTPVLGSTPESGAIETEEPDEESSAEMEGTEETQQPAQAADEDVKAQMAGSWRMDWPNPANAVIMILFADGRWESPGPLPTDYDMSGSFVIAEEETGIYHLRLTIEHATSPYTEIGHVLEGYYFDTQNDLLFTVMHSGEGSSTTKFIRE